MNSKVSLLHNYQETGITVSDVPPGVWSVATAKPVRRHLPPPVFWTQNPCFHEVADGVSLQNIHNKGVICKIVQDKELAAHLVDD
jgi:hypothetical protein